MSKIRHKKPVKRRDRDEPSVRTLSTRYPDGFVLDAHSHEWSQLLHASQGVMVVDTEAGSWVVPPHRAIWLPSNASHRVTMRGEVAMQTAYFADEVPLNRTCVVEVSPLLRELLKHCALLGKLDERIPHEARLAGLLIDLLSTVETMPLALPMPRDERALRVAHAIRNDPSNEDVLSVAGASQRTIERIFVTETGMPLGRWRQQARLLSAMTKLAEGASVTEVALDVGYASPSAFIAMFKSTLGKTPSRFFTPGS
jgi:AraC-like DNA-binding protein